MLYFVIRAIPVFIDLRGLSKYLFLVADIQAIWYEDHSIRLSGGSWNLPYCFIKKIVDFCPINLPSGN
jgi:hypothetical protein